MSSPRDTWTVRLAAALYLVSGVAALVYQVAWQRILALYTGVGLYSVAVIVAAFMAGLGAGSHLGGGWSVRLDRRGALRRFALVEMSIGAFGVASPWIYYDWLYPHAARLPVPSWPAGLVHFAAVGPPTLLMGISLPLLTRAVVPDVQGAGRAVGLLYALNMAGGGLGALATPWLLVPRFGIRGALVCAGVGSVLVGLGGWALLRRVRDGGPAADAADSVAAAPASTSIEPPASQPFAHWLWLYAFSGFVALSLEMLWFRVLDVAVKSTAFTFGTVLAVYLLGSAAGCLVGILILERILRPLRAFLLAQCAMLAATGLGLLLLVHGLPDDPFATYWRGYQFFALGRAADLAQVARLYLLLPLLLFGLPTFLMGFSFPVLQRAVHDDVRTSGRKVGILQAANIAGCVLGSLLVGLAAVGGLGTAATARAVVLAGIVFAGLGWRRYGPAFAAPLLLIVALGAALPGGETLWRRLHGLGADGPGALFEEDATGVVALTEEPPDTRWRYRLSINGKGSSWLPFGGSHTALGAVPAIVHALPRRVAIVGLGSGDTAWAAACRPETESVTVVELSSPQPLILRRLLEVERFPDLRRFLGDPRVAIRIADGRQVLQSEPQTYDLIEADAIWPAAAYSGNLYSVEFFDLCARRLRPGGIVCTWAPTERVRATFTRVLPYVLAVGDGSILVGSRWPVPLDRAAWLHRLDAAADYLGHGRARAVRQRLLSLAPAGPPFPLSPNQDLFPRDEFAVP
ncbi:MAG TPA: fused MFS/spermidine synthase [Vicinamibacteria bacterium]|nr:fused MFS/spermidine synthase [Vicinamibacteria bacterium]